MKNSVTVTRKTTESYINVTLTQGALDKDYRSKIDTSIPFLNHMIEHIVYRSGINLALDIKLDKFHLTHVIAEDIGITIGRAIAEFVSQNQPTGFGDAVAIIDEAKASAAISFESRSLFDFSSLADFDCEIEGMYTDDLLTFLEGISQGANCTLHVDIVKGKNGHHIFEAAFRAVGSALGRALYTDPERAGLTAGVAGKVNYEVK